jgi:hypothetical protein
LDRLIGNLKALILQAVPQLQYALLERYTVVSCNPLRQTVDVRSQSTRVPDLTQVPLRAPGLVLDLLPGTQVRVGWDSDGAAYAVLGASGGLPPLVPSSGSGIKNNIDAGYIVVIQNALSFAVLQPLYFPAGVSGGVAAESARAAAVLAGNIAFIVHLNGGRVMPDAWTVP